MDDKKSDAIEILKLYSKYTLEKIFKSYNTIEHVLNNWDNCTSDDHYIFTNWLKLNFTQDQDVVWFYKKSAKIIKADTIDIIIFIEKISDKSICTCRFINEDISLGTEEYLFYTSGLFVIQPECCLIPVYLDYDKILGKKNE